MKRINLTHLAVAAALAVPGFAPAKGGPSMDELIRQAVTYPYHGGVQGGAAAGLFAAGQVATPGLFSVVDVKLDFAAIAAARVAAGQAAIGAADVLELIPVRAGTWVQLVALQVTTAEGAAATADMGDGTTPAGYLSNVDLNAIGFTGSLITSTYSVAVGGGKLYAADDTIDMVVDSASVDVAVVQAFAVLVDLRNYR